MPRKSHASFKTTAPEVRKGESLFQKKAFLIACEGVCTEPNYIKNLVKIEKLNKNIAEGTTVIIAPHQHSDPCGVLTDLLSISDKEDFDECWIVIDRDAKEFKGKGFGGHTKENFDKAIKYASENNIKVAFSNPCFELWIVLHFEYRDTECSRESIQKKALEKVNSLLPQNKKLKNVDELKSFDELYSILKDKTSLAIKFSEKLSENEAKQKNPSTSVHRLVSTITTSTMLHIGDENK
ncbi:MAG: RloB family protein [Treponema sp.]|nr:RloB family protein [Treponema sp.]